LAVAFDDGLMSRFFTVCVAATSVPFFFGDWGVQTHILYNLPVHVLSLFGLFALLKMGLVIGRLKGLSGCF